MPFLIFVFLLLAAPATAGVDQKDLPENTVWYLHADLAQMRRTASGAGLYDWVNGEIFVELNDEIGIDVNEEVDSITAFSAGDHGTVIIIKGPLSGATQKKVLDLARKESVVQELQHGRKPYFLVQEADGESHHRNSGDALKDLEDGAYYSFALKNTLLVTGNEAQMQELLDNNGRIAGSDSHKGALFVLTADKSFVQAGLNTDELSDDGDEGWDSKILRNTEMAALMVSDFDGMVAVEAQLVSTDPSMAQAIGGIANGLIAMQAFNSDLDQDIKNLIMNTRVAVLDNVLSINTVIAPERIAKLLKDID